MTCQQVLNNRLENEKTKIHFPEQFPYILRFFWHTQISQQLLFDGETK